MDFGQPLIFVHLRSERSDQVLKSLLKSFAVASVLALSAGAGHAATVSLRYDGPTVTSYAGVKFTRAPVDPVGDSNTAGAVGFNMTDVTSTGSILGSFIAWCLDITHPLGTRGSHLYTITSTPFSNSFGLDTARMARVQSVFDANYSRVIVTNRTQAAGFQIALWEALYDTDYLAGAGVFAVSSAGSYATVVAQANTYLAAAKAFSGARAWNLTFLQSAETPVRQNLVTATPVPVPAAAGLLLLALGALAAAGWRRRRTV
jgi:hypothetical protein